MSWFYSDKGRATAADIFEPPKLGKIPMNLVDFWQFDKRTNELVPVAFASGALQDGLLVYYNEQAPKQDAQVEARIEREPFFLADYGFVSSKKI